MNDLHLKKGCASPHAYPAFMHASSAKTCCQRDLPIVFSLQDFLKKKSEHSRSGDLHGRRTGHIQVSSNLYTWHSGTIPDILIKMCCNNLMLEPNSF
ncbi:hypothetical protein CDAR_499511 [Caerostris darwini]|uniref:Ycf15 n=1 Tax=Caerostris darwini TaxID=1538125 RepID=A0AAV4M724_9ARAC|nr:hypothetical protein CDAR_499511 [Caerostris darwini]